MHFVDSVISIVCATLLDPDILEKSRRRKGAFTRNCKLLPYWTVMKLLLGNIKDSIASTLDSFFSAFAREHGIPLSEAPRCSQQAFSKARAGISHVLFQECFERVLDFLCSPDSHDYNKRLGGIWGIQVIAIDGSKIPLPSRTSLLDKYGGMGRDASSPTAIASIAFDVLNERILDAQFEPLSIDERTLAMRHMAAIKAKNRVDLLRAMLVFDRGYASRELITYIEKDFHSKYLFRLRDKFNNTIDALPMPTEKGDVIDCELELYEGIRVRVLRFRLPGGTLETLITNDREHEKNLFRDLYFLRWPVEEEYKLIKLKIGLTCFRGYSENSILQEFWIGMLLTNISNVIKRETDGIIKYQTQEETEGSLLYSYKTNMNELAGCLSRDLPYIMDAESRSERMDIIKHMFELLIRTRVRDIKGSGISNPRCTPRNAKWYHNQKFNH